MKTSTSILFATTFLTAISLSVVSPTMAYSTRADLSNFGPQSPRDITKKQGSNSNLFRLAPDHTKLNLCNIHIHKNAEHKGPDYEIFAGRGEFGGYKANETPTLTGKQLADPFNGKGPFENVKPGDTIEVHWVFSSCDIEPGPGLGSCVSSACDDITLRVEAQVFLLVNDPYALDFADFALNPKKVNGKFQPKALPTGTGDPVVYLGSTTGPKYTDTILSEFEVTWSVRPQVAKLDINSLYAWAKQGNRFNETAPHGVRQILTDDALLSPISK